MPRQIPLFGAAGQLKGPLKEGFDRLWAAYPPRRPNPRAQAEAAFRLVCREHDPLRIAEAGEAFAAEIRAMKIDPMFVPHLATWLRQGRFLDYPPFTTVTASDASISASDQVNHPWWPAFEARGISAAEFRSWIAPLSVVSLTEGRSALLVAGTRFRADWVRQHYRGPLARALGVQTVDVVDRVQP